MIISFAIKSGKSFTVPHIFTPRGNYLNLSFLWNSMIIFEFDCPGTTSLQRLRRPKILLSITCRKHSDSEPFTAFTTNFNSYSSICCWPFFCFFLIFLFFAFRVTGHYGNKMNWKNQETQLCKCTMLISFALVFRCFAFAEHFHGGITLHFILLGQVRLDSCVNFGQQDGWIIFLQHFGCFLIFWSKLLAMSTPVQQNLKQQFSYAAAPINTEGNYCCLFCT